MAAEEPRYAEHDDAGDRQHVSQHRLRPVVPDEECDDEEHDDDQIEYQVRRGGFLRLIRHRRREIVDEAEDRGEQRSDDAEADEHDAERRPDRRVAERRYDIADERADKESDRERDENRMDRMAE